MLKITDLTQKFRWVLVRLSGVLTHRCWLLALCGFPFLRAHLSWHTEVSATGFIQEDQPSTMPECSGSAFSKLEPSLIQHIGSFLSSEPNWELELHGPIPAFYTDAYHIHKSALGSTQLFGKALRNYTDFSKVYTYHKRSPESEYSQVYLGLAHPPSSSLRNDLKELVQKIGLDPSRTPETMSLQYLVIDRSCHSNPSQLMHTNAESKVEVSIYHKHLRAIYCEIYLPQPDGTQEGIDLPWHDSREHGYSILEPLYFFDSAEADRAYWEESNHKINQFVLNKNLDDSPPERRSIVYIPLKRRLEENPEALQEMKALNSVLNIYRAGFLGSLAAFISIHLGNTYTHRIPAILMRTGTRLTTLCGGVESNPDYQRALRYRKNLQDQLRSIGFSREASSRVYSRPEPLALYDFTTCSCFSAACLFRCEYPSLSSPIQLN